MLFLYINLKGKVLAGVHVLKHIAFLETLETNTTSHISFLLSAYLL